jgi:hypothetical protein
LFFLEGETMSEYERNYDDQDDEGYAAGRGREFPSRIRSKQTHRTISYRRRGTAPVIFNGMHRRRQRRIMW